MGSFFNESLAVKEKDEHYFGIATWFSYGLYTLGWSLALVGKLYGPSEAGSDNLD